MNPSRRGMLLAPQPGPATLKTRPWGGTRLAALRDPDGAIARPIGESWEFSTLTDSESRCDDRSLQDVLGRPLGFLVKLLDTAHELSIQVHPDDDPATGRIGKEEAWVVLDADPGARVLAGLQDGVDAAAFEAAAQRVRRDHRDGHELVAMLASIPVQRGTVVLVPAGTVHAVGGGILLAELQQPVDCTLRLYDYGSDRELHVQQAIATARVAARPLVWQPGEAPTRLAGRHLDVDVLAPGRHRVAADEDVLIVACAGTCALTADDARLTLPPGALRLATGGLEFELEVPSACGAVLGRIR